VDGERDMSVPAAAMGDPARARMLTALLGGLRVPAGELARSAGVAPSTASEHLKALHTAGLVGVEAVGRRRYYALAGDDVARAIEAMQVIAPAVPVTSLRQHRVAGNLRAGRRCYDHLAGDLGLRVTDLLVASSVLRPVRLGETDRPAAPLPHHPVVTTFALDDLPSAGRRPYVRGCLDWTARRPHAAGRIGAHLLTLFHDRGWIRDRPGSRAVHLTDTGEQTLTALESS
jgi:DNA-binding transcriptional ArsR family regulator